MKYQRMNAMLVTKTTYIKKINSSITYCKVNSNHKY